MTSGFAVKVRDFEGPLEILLDLIEERKMLISDVSLTNVADNFLEYLRSQNSFPLGQAAHFVYVSATLLLLKSRSLLPVLSLTDDEEGNIKDLEFRLRLYQLFRGVSKALPNGLTQIFFGSGSRIVEPIFAPPPDLSPKAIEEAVNRVFSNAPQMTRLPETTVSSVMSLEEMIDKLSARIEQAIHLTFSSFSHGTTDTREIVVAFLAMLELVKRGLLLVEQERHFEDITMNYHGNMNLPRYD